MYRPQRHAVMWAIHWSPSAHPQRDAAKPSDRHRYAPPRHRSPRYASIATTIAALVAGVCNTPLRPGVRCHSSRAYAIRPYAMVFVAIGRGRMRYAPTPWCSLPFRRGRMRYAPTPYGVRCHSSRAYAIRPYALIIDVWISSPFIYATPRSRSALGDLRGAESHIGGPARPHSQAVAADRARSDRSALARPRCRRAPRPQPPG